MATGNSILKSALRILNVKSTGEALSPDEQTDGQETLNDLIDSWSNEKLMIPALAEITHTLTAGDGTYTIGSGGDIDTTWPRQIESAHLRRNSSGSDYDYEMRVITNAEYTNIVDKGIQTDFPTKLYIRQAFPLATISMWPIPNTADTLVLQVWDVISQITDMTATISVPPGYVRALKYNLALELAPEYLKTAVHPNTTSIAASSKKWIKVANNKQTPPQRIAAAYVTRRGRGGNIFTGGIS